MHLTELLFINVVQCQWLPTKKMSDFIWCVKVSASCSQSPSNAAANKMMLGGCPGCAENAQLIAESGPVFGNPIGSVALIGKPREASSRFMRICSLFLNSQALQPLSNVRCAAVRDKQTLTWCWCVHPDSMHIPQWHQTCLTVEVLARCIVDGCQQRADWLCRTPTTTTWICNVTCAV